MKFLIIVFLLNLFNILLRTGNAHQDILLDPVPTPPRLICPQLTADNISLAFKGEWLVKFYAPWCPACQNFQPTWEEVASHFNQPHKSIRIAKVDVTQEPLISSHFMVTALPTIFHINDGQVRIFHTYKRTFPQILKYLKDREWEETLPIAFPFHPYSPLMSVFAYVIYFAMVTQEFVMNVLQAQNQDHITVFYIGISVICGCLCFGVALGLFIYFCCGVSKYQSYVPKKAREEEKSEKGGKTKVD